MGQIEKSWFPIHRKVVLPAVAVKRKQDATWSARAKSLVYSSGKVPTQQLRTQRWFGMQQDTQWDHYSIGGFNLYPLSLKLSANKSVLEKFFGSLEGPFSPVNVCTYSADHSDAAVQMISRKVVAINIFVSYGGRTPSH